MCSRFYRNTQLQVTSGVTQFKPGALGFAVCRLSSKENRVRSESGTEIVVLNVTRRALDAYFPTIGILFYSLTPISIFFSAIFTITLPAQFGDFSISRSLCSAFTLLLQFRWHEQLTDTTPFLNVNNQRYEDSERERTINRCPLATLLEVNTQNYQAIVSDGSTIVSITCFSDQANSLTRDCNEILAKLADKNPFHLPPSLIKLEGTTHTFQFHFHTGITSRRPDFALDTVFRNPPLPMLAFVARDKLV
ncbi:hypothetical protein Tco_0691290 [Tanacetum coccineum]